MSITRLQQARQMYALGQRVAKTMDGSRPGYGGPQDHGDEAKGTGAYSGGNGNDNNKPETTRPNPHTDSGTSKTSVATGDEMRSAARDFVQTLNTNNAIRANQTGTKFTPYEGGSKNYKEPFFDTGLGKFVKGVGKTALMAYAPQIFGPKFATGMKLYKGAKVAKDFLDQTDILSTLDVKNPIANLFSGNKTSTSKSKSTSKNNTTNNGGGDGEGIASLDNQASGYDEYILLLQKLQSGNISDSERNRYNVLKNMLGI